MWCREHVEDFNFTEISRIKKGSPSFVKFIGVECKGYPETFEAWLVSIDIKNFSIFNLSLFLNRLDVQFFTAKIKSSYKIVVNPSTVLYRVSDMDDNNILKRSKNLRRLMRMNFIISEIINCSCNECNVLIFRTNSGPVPISMSFSYKEDRRKMNTSLKCISKWGIDPETPYGIDDLKFLIKRVGKDLGVDDIPQIKENIKNIMINENNKTSEDIILAEEVTSNFQTLIMDFD